MAKTTLTKLNLKKENNFKTVQYNGLDIKIKQYLPINEKYDIIMIALEGSRDAGNRSIFNPAKLDTLLHLFIVYLYTDIGFTDKQKEDTLKVYDLLKESGLLDLILENIPEEEYNSILHFVEELEKKYTKYENSLAGAIQNIKQTISNSNLKELLTQIEDIKSTLN